MTLDFNKYANDGTRFIKELAEELGDSNDTARAGRVLRSILHAIRSRLTNEESVQMLAQLPHVFKGCLSWEMDPETDSAKNKQSRWFYNEIRELSNHSSNHYFITDREMKHALSAVLSVLKKMYLRVNWKIFNPYFQKF